MVPPGGLRARGSVLRGNAYGAARYRGVDAERRDRGPDGGPISMMRKQRLGEKEEKSPELDEAHSSIIAGVAHLRPVRGITFTTNNAAKFVKRSDNGTRGTGFLAFLDH